MQKSELAVVVHDQNKLNRVLDTAGELFSQHGYAKTSIRSLATEADVSTSTIYSYFADKSDLLLTLLDRRLTLIEQKVLEASTENDDPINAISTVLSIIHKALSEDLFLRKIVTFDHHVIDQRLHERADLARERIKQLALSGLNNAVLNGQLDCQDVEALESLCRLSFHGWLLSIENGSDEITEHRLTRMLVHLIEGRRL